MAVVRLTKESAAALLAEVNVVTKDARRWLWHRFRSGDLPCNRNGRDFFFDPQKVKMAFGCTGEGDSSRHLLSAVTALLEWDKTNGFFDQLDIKNGAYKSTYAKSLFDELRKLVP